MKSLELLPLICAISLFIVSCSKSSYHIKNTDISQSTDCFEKSDVEMEKPFFYVIEPDVPRQVQSIDSRNGKALDNVVVDLASILERSACSVFGKKTSALVYVKSYKHRSNFSSDTGSTSVAVRILLSAQLDCGDGYLKAIQTSHLSKKYHSRFMAKENDIQEILIFATNDAANGLSDKLQSFCEGNDMNSEGPKVTCPPGWTKDYDGCNPG